MKRIITAAAALLISVASFAQNDNPPQGAPQGGQQMRQRTPMTAEQRAKRETDRVNSLTPLGDAYQKVMNANLQAEQKKESIANGAKRNEFTDDQKAQMKAANEAQKKDVEAAMGPDLYKKYKEAEKAKREERKSQGGGQQGPPNGGGNGQ